MVERMHLFEIAFQLIVDVTSFREKILDLKVILAGSGICILLYQLCICKIGMALWRQDCHVGASFDCCFVILIFCLLEFCVKIVYAMHLLFVFCHYYPDFPSYIYIHI